MPRLGPLSRKPALWLGFTAVLVPLLTLLAFQYRWLLALQEKEAIAQQATLENYLEAVTSEVRYHYASRAERWLNLPTSLFEGRPSLDGIERFFRSRPLEGAEWLFVVFVGDGEEAKAVFFDPECGCWGEPSKGEIRAVHVAAAPWLMLGLQGTPVDGSELHVEEKDTNARMILNPLTNEDGRLVGVAGMIVDPDHFRDVVLPASIDKSLPRFFSEEALSHYMVRVEDNAGEVAYASDCLQGDEGEELPEMAAAKPFRFIFRDWGIAVQNHGSTPQEWARGHFMLNLGLSALLGVVVLSGTVFTLRTASREVRLSQMKSDFVSNVSHELRTPLASIQAFGELLRRGRARTLDKAREYGDYIETESRRLSELVNGILDFSRIESGQQEYRFEVVDLRGVMDELLATSEMRLAAAGLRGSLDCAQDPVPVRADRGAILLALANLLDNAIKYSEGGSEVRLRAEREGPMAVASVQDFGVGISRGERKRIFERFHRVSSGLVHDVKGSGLGLSIVLHIVKGHEGTVEVESEVGKGSTFTVRLPLVSEEGSSEPRESG